MDEKVKTFMESKGFYLTPPLDGRDLWFNERDQITFNQALANYMYRLVIEARKDELTTFDPLMHDHTRCLSGSSCMGYQNAESDWQNERDIRIAELDRALDGVKEDK